jgi:Transcription factor TFIID complex subunit 8 C-term
VEATILQPPPSRSPSPDLLPSDDEDVHPAVPNTLRGLPLYMPNLPPKHTYLRTPVGCLISDARPILRYLILTALTTQKSCAPILREETQNCQSGANFPEKSVISYGGQRGTRRWRIIGSYRKLGNRASPKKTMEDRVVVIPRQCRVLITCNARRQRSFSLCLGDD